MGIFEGESIMSSEYLIDERSQGTHTRQLENTFTILQKGPDHTVKKRLLTRDACTIDEDEVGRTEDM